MELAPRSIARKQCPLCSFEAPSVPVILSHLRSVHSSDPHFNVTCGLGGCATTSKSFLALYSHIYRYHKDYIRKRKHHTDSALPVFQDGEDSENFSCESLETMGG